MKQFSALLKPACATSPRRRTFAHRLSLTTAAAASLFILMPRLNADGIPHKKATAGKPSAKHILAKPDPMNSVKAVKAEIARLQKAAALRKKKDPDADAHEKKQNEAEEAGTDYYEAYLYYLQQRAYPKNAIDYSAYARAYAQRDRMAAARIGKAGAKGRLTPTGVWQFVGPNNLTIPYNTYYGRGPLAGRVNGFAFDSTAPGTYYLASVGGVWKTTNSGTTWTPLSDTWPNLRTSCIAIDPANHNTLYAGTGDYEGNQGTPYGIMKTTDGGATWTNYGKADFGEALVSAIVVDPETPALVTLTSGRGVNNGGNVWRSTDGGVTWNDPIGVGTNWSDLAISAKDGTGLRYYYAVGNLGQIFRSADRGVTWTQLSIAAFPAPPSEMRIATSPLDAKTVYLMDCENKMLWKSTNAGAAWTNITAGFPAADGADLFYNWSQSTFYDRALVCSSQTVGGNTTDVLYASLIDMTQYYFDAGASAWKWRSVGQTYQSDAALLHNDQHALAVNPSDPNTLLVGCDGGAYRFAYDPNASTWNYTSLNAALGITQFYKAAFHPTDPNRMLGGAQDNASPTSTGNLSTWGNFGGGDGGFSDINPNNTNVQYTSSQNLGITETTDNWATNHGISPDYGTEKPSFIAPVILDKKSPQYLYGGTNYLYRRDDTTGIWTPHVGTNALATYSITYIAVAPSDSNRIYTGSNTGELYMSTNFGGSFMQINTGTPALPNRAITYMAVDPTNPSKLYVTVGGSGSGHVFVCANTTAGARVWTDISGAGATGIPDINTNTIALDTDSPTNTYYVGNDVGVFMTTNGGTTWTNATQPLGLPNVQVNELAAVAGQHALYAATFGRGIWKINLAAPGYNVSGNITLEGVVNPASIATGSSIGAVTFIFRPTGGGSNLTKTATLGANGAYTLTSVPPGTYNLAIKAGKWLQVVVPVTITVGNVTGVNASLKGGDADNNNIVDIADFGILVNAYGGQFSTTGSGYNNQADFNCDGIVDIADFGILVNNYGSSGTP